MRTARDFLLCLWVGLTAACKSPNIVFMLVDDLGWSDVSFHGSKQIPTPNVDALARDGIILNQYYVQPLCSPSRGCLMTGKYSIHIGFQHRVIRTDEPWGLPLKEKILPQYLKEAGYATHAIGKWHLGFCKKEFLPTNRGFDSFFGYYTGLEDYYTHVSILTNMTGLDLHENGKNARQYDGIYGPDLFAIKAKKVIENHDKRKPLFLYFAQQAPHSGNFNSMPLQAPERYVAPLIGIKDRDRQVFGGMVSAMDHSVGEIFETLERAQMLDDTLFIFSTDNGGAVEGVGGARGSNFPLRGSKFNLWEGGVRGSAFVWSARLRKNSRIHNGLMHMSDWLPTLLSAAGISKSKLPPIDGFDMWSSLMGTRTSPRTEIPLNIDDLFGTAGIRRGRYKYLYGSDLDGKYDGWYDIEGRHIEGAPPEQSPSQKMLYRMNYLNFLSRSKAPLVLFRNYGRHPLLATSCCTRECKEQLEVDCNLPRPDKNNCHPLEAPCLFDVVSDPCEFYNLAEVLPEVTAQMAKALSRYRSSMVPPGNKESDPRSDPKFHHNAWMPWL